MTASASHYRLGRCDPEEVDSCAIENWLGAEEMSLFTQLPHPKRRRDWLAGRMAAKRLIALWLAEQGLRVDPQEVEILNDTRGVPYARLPEGEDIPISISHSFSGGVAALGKSGAPIGVDIEAMDKRSSGFLSIMMHESEQTPELPHSPLEQTRLWTAKEAVSKLLGVGLSVDLWDIRFVPEGAAKRLELHGKAHARWLDLGSPDIRLDTLITHNEALSIAYTAMP